MITVEQKEQWFSRSRLFLFWNFAWIGSVVLGYMVRVQKAWIIVIGGGVAVMLLVLSRVHARLLATAVVSLLVAGGVLLGGTIDRPSEVIDEKDYATYYSQTWEPNPKTAQYAAADVFDRQLPYSHAALMKAMILNLRGDISYELRRMLARTGTSHIVAISGMHIGIIIGLIGGVLYVFGTRRPLMVGFTALILGLYVALIGAPASAIRASIMGILVMIAILMGRGYASIHSIALTASLMILFDPLTITTVSFQLSFTAVLGILLFKAPFDELLAWVPKRLFVRDLLSVSLAVQVLLWPLGVYYFESLSTVSPLSNLLILPLLPLIVGLGVLGALVGVLGGVLGAGLSAVLLAPVWLLIDWVLWVIGRLSSLDLALLKIPQPSLAILLLYYLFIFIIYGLFKAANTRATSAHDTRA